MLKTALPRRRHAVFARLTFLRARAALIRNGGWRKFGGLELRGCILRRNQRQGGDVEWGGLIHDDFAHGFAATIIEQRPQG